MMNTKVSDMSPFMVPESMSASVVAEPFRRSGSLPFKKRKLYRTGSGSACDDTQSEQKFPFGASNLTCFGGNDEKIAALALVAAATSALPVANDSFPGLFLSSPGEHAQRMHVIQDEARRESPESHSSEESGPQDESSSPLGELKAKLRVQHPPLTSPLPGGCHGRTSRNNSYCRRHPCYNGSKYCKLHYQMHVVKGMRPEESSNSDTSSAIVERGRESPPTLPSVHTDKRFQGLEGEVRCSATTTRGRECSYIRVNGTKFCFLHADYAINPPPRRGGNIGSLKMRAASVSSAAECTSSVDTAKSPHGDDFSEAQHGTILLKTPNRTPTSVTSEESSLSAALVTPQASSVSDSPSSPKLLKKKKKNPPGKPVLSSLSYDQWFDKKVMISTGPLVNHTGRVVKWGNGWVTVRISSEEGGKDDDGLLHNRRAIELFLMSDDSEEMTGATSRAADVVASMNDPSSPLRRCVSIDVHSSELQLQQGTMSPSEHSVAEVDMREEERPGKTLEEKESKTKSFGARDDVTMLDTTDAAVASPSSVKPTKAEDSLPLVKSLMLTQEGCRQQGLELLFGTAALERGRRKVHKPTRYEDTAMLEKPRTSRQSSEHDLFPSCKRTPVSSPRSPRKLPAKN